MTPSQRGKKGFEVRKANEERRRLEAAATETGLPSGQQQQQQQELTTSAAATDTGKGKRKRKGKTPTQQTQQDQGKGGGGGSNRSPSAIAGMNRLDPTWIRGFEAGLQAAPYIQQRNPTTMT